MFFSRTCPFLATMCTCAKTAFRVSASDISSFSFKLINEERILFFSSQSFILKDSFFSTYVPCKEKNLSNNSMKVHLVIVCIPKSHYSILHFSSLSNKASVNTSRFCKGCVPHAQRVQSESTCICKC